MAKWGFSNQEWYNNGIVSGNDIDVAIKIQNNLFSPNEEPIVFGWCFFLKTLHLLKFDFKKFFVEHQK